MIEWNIQSRARVCQACRRHFDDKEPFHTLLFDQKHAYERLDVCESCWTAQFSQGATDRKGFVSYWQGIYSSPAPAPAEPIQKETAESLLRKLIELNDPAHGGALFILAVMLERKRLFKIKAQLNQNGQRAFVYEHAKNGDLFTIPDPNLQLDQLEEVQRDVAQLLEHGLPANGNPAAAPESGTAPLGNEPEPSPTEAAATGDDSAAKSDPAGPTPTSTELT